MTTHLDRVIAADLDALRADCRADLDLATADGAYRDGRAGAERRRAELADQRRGELAALTRWLMPVFAHRVARIATGASMLVTAALTFAAFRDPATVAEPDVTIPGLVMLHAIVYVVALGLAQRAFRRRMAATDVPAGDVYRDLARLAVPPFDRVRAVVDRLAGASLGVALAGVGALTVAMGGVFAGASYDTAVETYDVGVIQLALGLEGLVVPLGAALVGATLLAGACRRTRAPHEVPAWMRVIGSPWAALAGVVTAAVAIPWPGASEVPSTGRGFAFGSTLALAALFTATAVLLWVFRRELVRIREAGAEVASLD